ncbi:MAG: phosphoglycerate mutase [Methanoregulaceae archaeon]|nr:phosphoglycerate mutase [Methanoregulaceae archaeon]
MTADKVLLLIIDGVSDRPCPDLRNLTPLQAAKTPVLDRIAAEGICGIMDTIAPGIRPGSDTSHLSLLGYPPESFYTGRGPLEAVGTGILMEPGMIGFRCNYATLDNAGKVIDRRAGRIHDTADLTHAVMEEVDLSPFGIEVLFRSGTGHRAALAFRGRGLGACVSSNDPKKDGVSRPPFRPLRDSPADRKTADALDSFVRQADAILAEHPLNRDRNKRGLAPANTILIRGAGEMGNFPPFSERYGLSGSVIAAATLINGIGTAVGLRKALGLMKEGPRHRLDHHLSDAVTATQADGSMGVRVQQAHTHFTAISRVDRARCIDDRNAVPCGQAASGMDKCR